ncbi:TrkH family potassium uptake protein [Streptomyces sp. 8N616]|uniref:TrkH family potassium uptake protein n=1 Tax=Streptomyces sp. 8N616 TaxID=3457414 RepID=UPI003FD5E9FA
MRRPWWSRLIAHPARAGVFAFALAIVAGALLLTLPLAAQDGTATNPLTTVFTSTSAVCVTGLAVVDTGTYWSGFGQSVILGLIQVGGFGIMTFASLLGLLVSGRLRLRMQLTAQAETKTLGIGDVRRVLLGVAATTLAVELAVGAVLALRLRFGYGRTVGEAAFSGFFHAVSAFNNAGFGLHADSLVGYTDDPWVTLPIAAAVILGGIGFPVLLELLRGSRQGTRSGAARHWSLHTRLTVGTTAVLLVAGTALTLGLEWSNPGTIGLFSWPHKLLSGFFYSAMSRTAGFNAIDVAALEPATLLGTCILMFIGGGSAGTAGGIKVTTFAVLAAAILAEARGDTAVDVMGRRIAPSALRQALTVALVGVGCVIGATLALLTVAGDAAFEAVLFEAVSAFATVGLSTGITPDLPDPALVVLIGLMFVGRLGPITLASALALRERARRYQLPEERPVIG